MLTSLRQPVYGLIFLFQYLPGLEKESEEQDATGVWFANQVGNRQPVNLLSDSE
jgi:ubiquitin carboxyl-terminal hydrolase L5